MFQRIIAAILLTVSFGLMTGCAIQFHPGNLTIGGGATYATNSNETHVGYDNIVARENGIRFSSKDNLWYETYTLANGVNQGDSCVRSWSAGTTIQNGPGKRYDYSENRYRSNATCTRVVRENANEICVIKYTIFWEQNNSQGYRSNRTYNREQFIRDAIPTCTSKPKK